MALLFAFPSKEPKQILTDTNAYLSFNKTYTKMVDLCMYALSIMRWENGVIQTIQQNFMD